MILLPDHQCCNTPRGSITEFPETVPIVHVANVAWMGETPIAMAVAIRRDAPSSRTSGISRPNCSLVTSCSVPAAAWSPGVCVICGATVIGTDPSMRVGLITRGSQIQIPPPPLESANSEIPLPAG